MKLLMIAMMLLSFSVAASFDCQSVEADKKDYRLIVVEKIGAPSTLTVKHKGETIYHKGVVSVDEATDRVSFRSLSFTNKNDAPAGLFVSVYRSEGKILGNFNEGSYLPVVPYLQLSCKQF